jgi:hypothetical protein
MYLFLDLLWHKFPGEWVLAHCIRISVWGHFCWHCHISTLSLLEVIKEFVSLDFAKCRLSFCHFFNGSCPCLAVQFLYE